MLVRCGVYALCCKSRRCRHATNRLLIVRYAASLSFCWLVVFFVLQFRWQDSPGFVSLDVERSRFSAVHESSNIAKIGTQKQYRYAAAATADTTQPSTYARRSTRTGSASPDRGLGGLSSISGGSSSSVTERTVDSSRSLSAIEWLNAIRPSPSSPRVEHYVAPFDKALNDEEAKKRSEGFAKHAFNEFFSDKLSFHRKIPDTRPEKCLLQKYRSVDRLPSITIIICFYEEALSVLLRALHSIVDRTPKEVLKEIILIDDYSIDARLKASLDGYLLKHLPAAKVVRNKMREGLIRSRMIGAELATGDVLVFLDSHVEANVGWLEPLLDRIASDTSVVAMPVIDVISDQTLEYEASRPVRGSFTWRMFFTWEPLSREFVRQHGEANPYPSPTMAGGLYAMDKKLFFRLGGYDKGMDIWGAENLEMSFRVWQCGGRLEIVPCSRVGHIFRRRRPYGPDNTASRNALRVAHVWLDEFKDEYFRNEPSQEGRTDYGDVRGRLALKKQLGCRPFRWYLENVCPQMMINGTADLAQATTVINETATRVPQTMSAVLKEGIAQ